MAYQSACALEAGTIFYLLLSTQSMGTISPCKVTFAPSLISLLLASPEGLNDLPLLRMADVAIAVENAVDEVKAEADIIIGPNTSDAVARYIHDNL